MSNPISQLDLLMMGQNALPAQVRRLDRSVSDLQRYSTGAGGASAAVPRRPNLALNPSFEYFVVSAASAPLEWQLGGTAVLEALSGTADGRYAVRLGPGGFLRQTQAAPAGSMAVSLYARATALGALNITLSRATSRGPLLREDANGNVVESGEAPADGQWYRFWQSGSLSGSDTVELQIDCVGGSVYVDAVKFEVQPGAFTFIEPTSFGESDAAAAAYYRTLYADHITAGTLTVGGAGDADPRIVVEDLLGDDLVVIGYDQASAYSGIHIKGAGGLRVSGEGSVEVTGTGRVLSGTPGGARTELNGSGLVAYGPGGVKNVELASSEGRLRVLSPRGMSVEGDGSLVVGNPTGARTEVKDYGVVGYDATGKVIFGLNEAGAVGSLDIQNGDVLIGNGGTSYAFWDNSEGKLKIRGTVEASTVIGSSIQGGTLSGTTVTGTNISGSTVSGSTVFAGSANQIQLDQNGIRLYGSSSQDDIARSLSFHGDLGRGARMNFAYASGSHNLLLESSGLGYARGGRIAARVYADTGKTSTVSLGTQVNGVSGGAEIIVQSYNFGQQHTIDLIARWIALNGTVAPLSVGDSGQDYFPSTSNWQSGGANLLLNGKDFTSVIFHDAGARVDAILAGGGRIRVGYNVGWGTAVSELSGGAEVYGVSSFGGPLTANQRLRIHSTGDDGNHSPLTVVNAAGSAGLFYIRSLTASSAQGYLANTSWTYASDERLKEEIEDELDGIEKLRRVRPIRFRYKGAERGSRGFSAQQLQTVFPDLVEAGEDGVLGVRTGDLIPVLLKAALDLDKELDRLRKRVKALEAN